MCGGFISKVTDAIGLTDTKAAKNGYDAQAAEEQAKAEAQKAENAQIARRKKRKASEVLSSAVDSDKKQTLGG